MATLTVCDLCGTNKHDESVTLVEVSINGADPMRVDLCENHQKGLNRWLRTVDEQRATQAHYSHTTP